MRSEQVYWVFTVTVDQMDKFKPLVPKLVAATEKEPGALQFECHIGADRKTVDFFERYSDSKAARVGKQSTRAPTRSRRGSGHGTSDAPGFRRVEGAARLSKPTGGGCHERVAPPAADVKEAICGMVGEPMHGIGAVDRIKNHFAEAGHAVWESLKELP